MRRPSPPPRVIEWRFSPNAMDRFNLSRLAESVRDARGSPFMDVEVSLRLALDITRRVIEAGELERFRAVPVALGIPVSREPDQTTP